MCYLLIKRLSNSRIYKASKYIKGSCISRYIAILFLILPSLSHEEEWKSFLNSSNINNMVSQGNIIYAATNGGVLVFNKKDTLFTKITNVEGLLSNNVKRLAIDYFGNIWCLCIGGGITLIRNDGNRWKHRNFTSWHGIQNYDFLSILIDSNVVWIGTENKILNYDTKGGNPFEAMEVNFVSLDILPSNKANVIKVIGNSLWFGTDKGIGVIDKRADFSDSSKWVVYDKESGLPSNNIQTIEFWSDMVWVGTDAGIARLKESNWEKVVEGLPTYRICDFASNDTALWVGTYYGIAKWNAVKWLWVDGNLTYRVTSILIDSLLWLGTWGNGIAKYDGATFHFYVPNEPASNRFSGMALGLDGSLWCTHYRGTKSISRYCPDDGRWQIYNKENEWGIGGGGPVAVVTDMSGNTYIGAWDYDDKVGLIKITPEDSVDTLEIPAPKVVSALHIDKDGYLWVGTWPTLLYKFKGDSIVEVFGQVGYISRIISDDSSNIWVGSYMNGLWELTKQGYNWKEITGLPSTQITALSKDINGNIWVGTMGGTCKIRIGKVVAKYTSANSDILGDVVCDITCDSKGNVWFAIKDNGVSKLDTQGQFSNYTVGDGLVSNQLSRIVFDTKTGYLWIGTSYGLSKFDTGSRTAAHIPKIEVYPNPFIPYKGHDLITFLPQELTEVSIKIYSIAGKLIKSIDAAPIVTWDAKDANGEDLGTGIYIFVATTKDGRKRTGKFAIIR